MAAIVIQHACSRPSDPAAKPVVFHNDSNNVAYVQSARLQKKLMEEETLRHQQAIKEAATNLQSEIADKEEVKKQRDRLVIEAETLQQALAAKETEVKHAEGRLLAESEDKARLQKEYNSLITQKNEIDTRHNTLAREKAETDTTNNTLMREKAELVTSVDARTLERDNFRNEITALQRKLPNGPQENCLPLCYDGATVMIVNLGSQMALDSGKDNGSKAHAWAYHVENYNQIFTLEKVSGGYWAIRRKSDAMKLYFPNGNTDVDVHVGTGIPDKQDYWYIGRGGDTRVGSWVFKNAEWNTYMELQSGGKDNGIRIKSYSFSNNSDANWVIIPFAFSN